MDRSLMVLALGLLGVGGEPRAAEPKRARETLRYDGKDFAYWCNALEIDLKPECRVEAIRALRSFGLNGYGKEAASALLELLRSYHFHFEGPDEDIVATRTDDTLQRLGAEVKVVFIERLKDKDAGMREYCIDRLAQLGDDDFAAAAPAVFEAMNDPNDDVCGSAIRALQSHGPEIKPFVSGLVAALRREGAQCSAAIALQKLGPKASFAAPELVSLFKKNNVRLRTCLVGVFKSMKPAGSLLLPTLIGALREQEDECSRFFAEEQREGDPQTVKDQIELLEYELELLRQYGPEGKAALPILVRLLKSPALPLCQWGVEGVAAIGPDAKSCLAEIKAIAPNSKREFGGLININGGTTWTLLPEPTTSDQNSTRQGEVDLAKAISDAIKKIERK